MARALKRVAVIDVELGDGMAFGMGDGAYLVVQHDEYGRRQAVLLSAEDRAVIAATERARVGGIAAPLRKAAERVLKAPTAAIGLFGRVATTVAERGAGDSLRSLAGMMAR